MPTVSSELRPGVTNDEQWFPDRLTDGEWRRLRKRVLERDDYTCYFCRHRATKWMNIHHIKSGSDNRLQNLRTVCVACHAVMHVGLNLQLRKIEIWESKLDQVEIVKRTRKGIREGKSLRQIKKSLSLRKGPYPPRSLRYANELLDQMGRSPRAYLDKPLCAVFTSLQRWQVEDGAWSSLAWSSLLKRLNNRSKQVRK